MSKVGGDLIALALEGAFDVIVHGCNCQNQMGAGIAVPIKKTFPEAYEADQATAKADPAKLGTISYVRVQRGDMSLVVVNAYTQFAYGRGKRHADYAAIKSCFEEIAKCFPGKHVAFPLIGAGLAGGDWAEIQPLIEGALADQPHTLVVLPT